ncbi:hypothetical protein PBY51_015754 [Eleginops maclovinus]|uniref:Uncharacterized protein n=1 Tax=Eleginops maclovinus TaxID=56733 RepID=A0AAN7XNU3_ELEMC|nr:hypothetical protein PBY51_015754 [Eleginops maclovinus]
MIGGLAALIFLSALSLIQTAEDPQQILLTILLGEGTTVETRQKYMDIYVPVLGTMLACCLIVIAVLIISRNQKPVGESSSLAVNDRLAKDEQIDVDIQTAMNYAALNFSSKKAKKKRWKNNSELPQDCMRDHR